MTDAGIAEVSERAARDAYIDAGATVAVAWTRALVIVGAAMATTLFGPSVPHRFGVAVFAGFVAVPWACALALAADRSPVTVRALGTAGDIVLIFLARLVVPAAGAQVVLGYVLVSMMAAAAGDRRFRIVAGAAAITAAVVGERLVPSSDRVDDTLLVGLALAVVALAVLIDWSASARRKADIRSALLSTKSAAILDRVADGVMVIDAGGVVTQCNEAAGRIVGCPPDAALGRHCGEVLGLQDGEATLDCSRGCALLAMGDGAESDLGQEVLRVSDTGRRQPLLANVSAVRDIDGEVIEIVHSFRDVTRLKEADEAKTLFLATASHELKTPLTVISGFTQALQNMPDMGPDERDDALGAIRLRTLELTRIVERLLMSSRIESGRAEVRIWPFDVTPILRERVGALRTATGRPVTLEAPPDLPLVVGDDQSFITVVDHLLDNAIKYSPGGGVVSVECSVDRDRVRVAVADEGIGMDSEQAAHCFDKFWQAESTDVRRFGGTGIGLYIVHSLVTAMGADITVHSEPGRGTTFTIGLPFADADAVVDPAVSEPDRAPAESEKAPATAAANPGAGERTSVREFMRQLGIHQGES